MKYRVALGLLVLNTALTAQTQPVPQAGFEVVSVKAHKQGDNARFFPQFLPGGRFRSAGAPLKMLIAIAYNLGYQSVRLSGGPAWINSPEGVYDIEATAPQSALPPGLPSNVREERMRQMLQTLLADQFKLKVRAETKEIPTYAIVVGKNGLKLEKAEIEEKNCPAADAEPTPSGIRCHAIMGGRGRGIHGEAISLSDVAHFVESWTDHPMVDKTGIPGLFNIQTKGWMPMQPGPPPAAGAKAEDGSDMADVPTIFALFESLGLKLEVQKMPVEVFVIEHAEKPTEN